MTKPCTKCGAVKPLADFYKKGGARVGEYAHQCKACHRAYYQAKGPTYFKPYKQKHVAGIKAWMAELKSTLSCVKCAESHPACLDFHHRDPSQKKFNIARAITEPRSRSSLIAELAKCDVLCANCHRKEHHNERMRLKLTA